ncbi:MAG: calcium/sodium antiporter [Proteobacteria bacterium]|nr:calcium/sodium antiporter [Pseudomonadota bacterium]
MEITMWVAILAISIAVLVLSSDYFVASAERIGFSLGLSHFVVGVVIVGFGTSLPELVSSLVSVFKNHSEIVIGNVLGSNITNIFLVLGIAGVAGKEFKVRYNLMKIDLPFLTGSSLLIAFMAYDRVFSMVEAMICLVSLFFYLYGTVGTRETDQNDEEGRPSGPSQFKDWLLLIVSSGLVFVGAKYTVDSVVRISEILAIGTDVIALSAVALGTSLPEVMVSVSAARKGHSDMIVGNIIGSNIFNTFGVMGLCGLSGKLVITENICKFSLPISVAAAFMYFVITKDQKINRSEGSILLIFYVFFIGSLFNWL